MVENFGLEDYEQLLLAIENGRRIRETGEVHMALAAKLASPCVHCDNLVSIWVYCDALAFILIVYESRLN